MARGRSVGRFALGIALCLAGLAVANSNDTPPVLVSNASGAAGHESRRGTRLCSSGPREVLCRYEDRCVCRRPGCECSVQWVDLTFGQMVASEVQLDVNVSCASLRRPGAFISNVAVTVNRQPYEVQVLESPVLGSSVGICLGSDSKWQPPQAELCQRTVRLVPSRRLPTLEGIALTSLEVRVGPGAAHCSKALESDPWACERKAHYCRSNNYSNTQLQKDERTHRHARTQSPGATTVLHLSSHSYSLNMRGGIEEARQHTLSHGPLRNDACARSLARSLARFSALSLSPVLPCPPSVSLFRHPRPDPTPFPSLSLPARALSTQARATREAATSCPSTWTRRCACR